MINRTRAYIPRKATPVARTNAALSSLGSWVYMRAVIPLANIRIAILRSHTPHILLIVNHRVRQNQPKVAIRN